MKPIRTPQTTTTLGAPKDWDDSKRGPCVGLPITQAEGVMYSWWKPSLRERASILLGRPIRLAVVGVTHPPVALDTLP